jgi:hypothetical protein
VGCRNTSCTLPFENRTSIERIALSPDNRVLITVDIGTAPTHTHTHTHRTLCPCTLALTPLLVLTVGGRRFQTGVRCWSTLCGAWSCTTSTLRRACMRSHLRPMAGTACGGAGRPAVGLVYTADGPRGWLVQAIRREPRPPGTAVADAGTRGGVCAVCTAPHARRTRRRRGVDCLERRLVVRVPPSRRCPYSTHAYARWATRRLLLTTARDLTARVWTAEPRENYRPPILGGHRDVVVSGFFGADANTVRARHHRLGPPRRWGAHAAGRGLRVALRSIR